VKVHHDTYAGKGRQQAAHLRNLKVPEKLAMQGNIWSSYKTVEWLLGRCTEIYNLEVISRNTSMTKNMGNKWSPKCTSCMM
jgi:hypothetical protein